MVVDGLVADGEPVAGSHEFQTGVFTARLDGIRLALEGQEIAPAEILATTTETLEWTAHRATLSPGETPFLPWWAWEEGTSIQVLQSTYAEAGGEPVELTPTGDGLTGPVPQGGGPVRIFQRYELWVPPGIEVSVGRFQTRWYLDDDRALELETPEERTVWFTRYAPAGQSDAEPIVYGNGYRSHRHHAVGLASALGAEGMALVALSAVGHGGGPDGTLTVEGETFPDGGRALDVDRDGIIALEEGMRVDAESEFGWRGLTDGVRQTAIDQMVFARALGLTEAGYFGISNGGRIGAVLVGTDPLYQSAVLNVPPSEAYVPIVDTWRELWAWFLELNGLINEPNELGGFDEGIPHRGQQVQIGLPEGAEAIQTYIDTFRRHAMPMNTAVYAPRFHERGKKVLVQIGRGDPVVTNMSSVDLVREGDLQATTCVVWPERSLWFSQLSDDPQGAVHIFAFMPDFGPTWQPGVIGDGARAQIATWLASDGEELVDPDADGDMFGLGDVFEVPMSDESLKLLDQTPGYDPLTL